MTITPETITNLEEDCIHIAEIAVGKEGGNAGGVDIDTSTDRLGQVKKTLPKILEEIQDVSTSVESHNNNPLAHGMTTPGAAIVQAASVAGQRAALGLANHQLVAVDSTGSASATSANLGGIVYGKGVVTATPSAGHFWICVGEFNHLAQVQVQVRVTSNNHEELLRIDVAHTYYANQARITVARHSYNSKVRSVAISSPAHNSNKQLWVEVGHEVAPIICSAWVDGLGFISHPASVRADGSQPSMMVSCSMLAGYDRADNTTYYGGAPSANHYQAGNIAHIYDNAWSFGTAERRATTAYLATNPVVGSDARLKCDYSVIPGDIAHELMLKIVPRVGKFIVGGQEPYEVEEVTTNEAGEEVTQKVTRYREVPGNRYHTYYLAQEVKAALDSVADRWPQAANLALWVLADVEDVDSIQMVRYEQMIPIIHAATVYQWQQK